MNTLISLDEPPLTCFSDSPPDKHKNSLICIFFIDSRSANYKCGLVGLDFYLGRLRIVQNPFISKAGYPFYLYLLLPHYLTAVALLGDLLTVLVTKNHGN